MTTKQIKYVRGLLLREGLHDQKDEIVSNFTNERTTHLSEMTHKETQELIKALAGETSRDRMINKMLSLAHEMQWELSNGKVDMNRLNAWCIKYSQPHKPLDEIKDNELSKVLTIFESVYQSFLKGI